MLNYKKPAFWIVAVAVAACVVAGVWFLTHSATAASQKLRIAYTQADVRTTKAF